MDKVTAALVHLAQGSNDLLGELSNQELTQFEKIARAHDVAGLCAYAWKNAPASPGNPSESAENLFDRLEHIFQRQRDENSQLLGEIVGLQEAFAFNGVSAMYFLGPWLAFAAYPDPGARAIPKINLGIRARDYAATVQSLKSAGYDTRTDLPKSWKEAIQNVHYGQKICFAAPDKHPVELHFRMLDLGPPEDRERWVWDSPRTLKLEITGIQIPGPEPMLIHLLLQANLRSFSCLRLFHDIRWALEKDLSNIDRTHFLWLVRKLKLKTVVYHGLMLAKVLAAAPVPDDLLEALRPARLRRVIYERLWNLPMVRALEAQPKPGELEAPMLYLLEMGGPIDKLHYLNMTIRQSGGLYTFLDKIRNVFSPDRAHQENGHPASALLLKQGEIKVEGPQRQATRPPY